MFIISPLSACASIEKRDEFLSHLSQIAKTTYANEPHCLAYAWFRSAADENTTVPAHWLRGFEVYETVEANQIDHRASTEYKSFRQAVTEKKLLERPSDLRFWRESGIGFLSREMKDVFERNAGEEEGKGGEVQYIVTDEFRVSGGTKERVYGLLREMERRARAEVDACSFWVLDRDGEGGDGYGNEVYVLVRCKTKEAYETFGKRNEGIWEQVSQLVEERRRTSWVEAGIGFFAR